MPQAIAIVPRPQNLTELPGSFELTDKTCIGWEGQDAESLAHLLADYLRPATGLPLPVVAGRRTHADAITLRVTGKAQPDAAGFVPEAYRIEVSSNQVVLESSTGAGLARAVQTLRQLLPPSSMATTLQSGPWPIPCVQSEDAPRFRWRGLMLDVSRHFFPLEAVKRFIDLLALHRYNMCHLHLSDDQGWRVEIKRYPRLTEIGSVRPRTLTTHEGARPRRYDDKPHGGFYTQEEIRDLVAFAARRHVTLVPEIDMPGHMQAAIAAYPELGVTGQPMGLRCHWGVNHNILNPFPATVQFMQNVLDEIMDLFPGRFIHVGGDEVPKSQWSDSMPVQAQMAQLGLKSEEEMQSWFIRQMDEHLTGHGRRLLGWDEILEGGLAPGATVMSWRGEEGGIAAASAGHDVVMAPYQHVYFDYHQAEPVAEEPMSIGGMTPTDKVYAYEPIPAKLDASRHHHVLGSQGQLWTEYIPDQDRLDYMAYPRACALAETLWLAKDQKRYPDFLGRLRFHRQRLDALGVNAHPRP